VTPAVERVMSAGPFARAERNGTEWTLDLPSDHDVREALAALSSGGVPLARFEHVKPSLHQIFVQQVGHAEIAERRPEVARA
jgi:ABC-type uncharacterized transport system ATPase subunit